MCRASLCHSCMPRDKARFSEQAVVPLVKSTGPLTHISAKLNCFSLHLSSKPQYFWNNRPLGKAFASTVSFF